MGLLDFDLATQIYKGFKGKLLTGSIRQQAVPQSGALDEYGDPIDVTPTDTAIEGFTEDYDDAFIARAGIPKNSIMVNIFAKSAPAVTPGKDDIVTFTRGSATEWYQLRRAKTDPATALWVCEAFAIEEPA